MLKGRLGRCGCEKDIVGVCEMWADGMFWECVRCCGWV